MTFCDKDHHRPPYMMAGQPEVRHPAPKGLVEFCDHLGEFHAPVALGDLYHFAFEAFDTLVCDPDTTIRQEGVPQKFDFRAEPHPGKPWVKLRISDSLERKTASPFPDSRDSPPVDSGRGG